MCQPRGYLEEGRAQLQEGKGAGGGRQIGAVYAPVHGDEAHFFASKVALGTLTSEPVRAASQSQRGTPSRLD